MDNLFFEHPILNSPYDYPIRHWELDKNGQPTQQIIENRRRAEFITPIPKPKKHKKSKQEEFVFDEGVGLSTTEQQYDPTPIINALRKEVDKWRSWPNPGEWQVTPETARLLQHWRHHKFSSLRPFFCQVEAAETVIWLTEVAPKSGKIGKGFLEHLANANNDANPGLMRLALKLATGAGKTTVMAMIIAWQTINAVRRPQSKKFTRGFLVVTPGLTIKDRLRVLQPNDPDSYYQSRELVPNDMIADLDRAKIVITNYHAFKQRERLDVSKGTRAALEGWRGETLELFSTADFLLLDVIHRERPIPEHLKPRVANLVSLGIIERHGRGRGVRTMLSRRFYALAGKKGVYTRKKGLDRETNKALLLKHIKDNTEKGTPLKELCQVLPAQSRRQIQGLLEELRSERKITVLGKTNAARWFLEKE